MKKILRRSGITAHRRNVFAHRHSSLPSCSWARAACLSGWTEIIVYPAAFRVSHDAASVVHHQAQTLIGESWARGPRILSWQDVEADIREQQSGCNVVIHEIAHKPDMLNEPADGFPLLHHGMIISEWSAALNAAYANLVRKTEHRHRTYINPYAATSPAEFFAVISEYFFCAHKIMHTQFPDVYRQNPLLRAVIGK